jgi:adenine deaminase
MEHLSRRIRVALGKEAADCVFAGGRIFNVFTGEFEVRDVVTVDGYVAAVLPPGSSALAAATVRAEGAYLVPGFIDSHVHIESSMVSPEEFALAAASCGVTTMVAAPHEIANVSGVEGIRYMLAATEKAAARVFFMLPSCVPASPLEDAGHTLSAVELADFLGHPRVLGLGEMMNYPGVIKQDREVMEKIAMIDRYNKATFNSLRGLSMDGHAPMVKSRDLMACLAAGIRSDHETSTPEEALERLALGMALFLREGSAAHNLLDLVPALTPRTLHSCALCTDDRHLTDLLSQGGINYLVKKLADDGRLPLADILRMASWNAAQLFSLRETGAIAPGYRADFALYPDLSSWRPSHVWRQGKLVVEAGKPLWKTTKTPADMLRGSVRMVNNLQAESLLLPDRGKAVKVIELTPGQLITRKLVTVLPAVNGFLKADRERDIAKLAVFERHRATGRVGLGFVKGMGLGRGAIASTIAHDSHNLMALGMNDDDMLAAVRALRDAGGGLAVADGGKATHVLPLPLGGIFSDAPLAVVADQLKELELAVRELGLKKENNPFMPLSFLSLAVIPSLKLTDAGLVDVDSFTLTSLYDGED